LRFVCTHPRKQGGSAELLLLLLHTLGDPVFAGAVGDAFVLLLALYHRAPTWLGGRLASELPALLECLARRPKDVELGDTPSTLRAPGTLLGLLARSLPSARAAALLGELIARLPMPKGLAMPGEPRELSGSLHGGRGKRAVGGISLTYAVGCVAAAMLEGATPPSSTALAAAQEGLAALRQHSQRSQLVEAASDALRLLKSAGEVV